MEVHIVPDRRRISPSHTDSLCRYAGILIKKRPSHDDLSFLNFNLESGFSVNLMIQRYDQWLIW